MAKPSPKEPSGEDQQLAYGVYRTLLERLVSQQIKPEERMSIDALSRDLDVSQTPVRQALARLEVEGLLTRVHLAGYRAAPLLTWAQLDQMFEMRLLLEPFAAGRAALNHTPEQALAMQAAEQERRDMERTVDRVTYGVFARADSRLHDLIADAAGNQFLTDAWTRLHAHVHLFRLHFRTTVAPDAVHEHEELLEAIVARDEAAATRIMRRHLRASRARLYSTYSDQQDRKKGLDTPRGEVHSDFTVRKFNSA